MFWVAAMHPVTGGTECLWAERRASITLGSLSCQFYDRVVQTLPPMPSNHVCPEMPMASAGQPGGRWGWTEPGSIATEMTAGTPTQYSLVFPSVPPPLCPLLSASCRVPGVPGWALFNGTCSIHHVR